MNTVATRPMTLAEFRAEGWDATRAQIADITGASEADCFPGRVYPGNTTIERGPNEREWCCTIGNDSRLGTLEEMEQFLYDWAVEECELYVDVDET